MVQEIEGLAQAVEIGAINIDTVATTTFGTCPEDRDRKAWKAAAWATTLGLVAGAARGTFKTPVAKQVRAEAKAKETRERAIVEASSREDRALDDARDQAQPKWFLTSPKTQGRLAVSLVFSVVSRTAAVGAPNRAYFS